MLKNDINDKRKERHKATQEDFTPVEICHILFEGQDELFKNFNKTFCDPCCGTELMEDNTEECKQKILMDCLKWSSSHDLDIKVYYA